MFDKKGRWWPSRLADKKTRKQWKMAKEIQDLAVGGLPAASCESGCFDCLCNFTADDKVRLKIAQKAGKLMDGLGQQTHRCFSTGDGGIDVTDCPAYSCASIV